MNINLKRAIVGLALSFSMGVANATAINLTSVYTHTQTTPIGAFSDVYDFFLSSLSGVGGVVVNVPVSVSLPGLGDISFYNISNLSMSLKNSIGTILGQGSAVNVSNLTSGAYSFTVSGSGSGSLGGIYTLAAVAAPVPEPSSWAMMLGGLGLIGFMSYRRRQYF